MRNIPFGKPIIGDEEKNAAIETLSGPTLVHGERVKKFEADFAAWTGAPHAVATSSCTSAMHLVWFHLGIGPGDEIIVPAQTHTATAHAVEYTGAKAVFADCEPNSGNVDIPLLESLITEKTKAIAIVHYLGMPVNMDHLCAVAKKHNLFVLEDCALAIGTKLRGIHAGLHGDAGCFSFYPVKHMTTAEGGMLLTRDPELAEAIGKKRAFGVDRHAGERKVPGVYDVNMLGFNYRINEIQSAIGIEQIKRLDGFLAAREENYRALQKGLAEIEEIELLESTNGDYTSSYYCMTAILKKDISAMRFEIVAELNAQGVGTSVYYPKPVPHMTYYRDKYGYDDQSFPEAARISYRSIALPVGPHLNAEDMAYIIDAVKKAIAKEGKRH